jgi:ATP-binding cassette, subfamily B, bacterial
MTKLRDREFIRVLAFIGPRSWLYYVSLVVHALTLGICFNLVLAFVLRDVVDAAVTGDRTVLLRGVALAVGTLVGGLPVLTISRYLIKWCARKTMTEVRLQVFSKIEALTIGSFESEHSGDLLSRCMNDVGQMEAIYGNHLQTLGLFLAMGLVGMAFVFTIEWRLGIVSLILGLATTLLNAGFAKPLRSMNDTIQSTLGKLTERLTDLLQSLPVTKMFHIERLIHRRYTQENDHLAASEIELARIDALRSMLAELTSSIRGVGILALGLSMVMEGQLGLGSIWAIVYLLGNTNIMFAYLGGFINYLQQCLAGASRVLELLDRPVEPLRYPSQRTQAAPSGTDDAMLALKDITFSYEEEEQAILRGISLSAEQGQRVALVGPSGGGKSTIVKLLLGFHAAQEGDIGVGGQPISRYTLRELRQMTAYVPQDAYLFDGSIEENIRHGKPGASKEDVIAAAKAANAHDFIMEQADGYATPVGERGAKLSGGQRQRIAIARALLKDAPILLLDEATSALDSESEQLVQAALDVLMEGRTTLAIAHRLSTIENADTIYVVEKGQVMEQGQHHELLAHGGLYSNLHAL